MVNKVDVKKMKLKSWSRFASTFVQKVKKEAH